MFKARIASAAFMLAAVAAFSVPATAQQINPARVIDMHVNVESKNRSFSGSVVEGKAFRLTIAGAGTFEIMPVLVSEGRYAVAVRGGPENAESADLRQVETVMAQEGVPVALRSMPRVGLVIEGSRIPQAAAMVRPASYTFASLPRAIQDGCCVVCDGFIACGCKVESSCGTCCVNPCCEPPVITLEGRFFPAAPRFASRSCGTPIRDEERLFTPAAQTTRIAAAG
ncbi:MAG: hypothetical protein KY467_12770 [Gemmatimonadetes bacterium]|nr:hypothetical protein [Gemmatimonadota bacterium]